MNQIILSYMDVTKGLNLRFECLLIVLLCRWPPSDWPRCGSDHRDRVGPAGADLHHRVHHGEVHAHEGRGAEGAAGGAGHRERPARAQLTAGAAQRRCLHNPALPHRQQRGPPPRYPRTPHKRCCS